MEESKVAQRFQGKVAIVTASTQGIGFSIAERLGLEGASVVISSRKQVHLLLLLPPLILIHVIYVFPHVSSLLNFIFLVELLQQNVDEAAEKLRAKGIEVLAVVCHVSNAQQRKNLIDKTVQVSFSSHKTLKIYSFTNYLVRVQQN